MRTEDDGEAAGVVAGLGPVGVTHARREDLDADLPGPRGRRQPPSWSGGLVPLAKPFFVGPGSGQPNKVKGPFKEVGGILENCSWTL